ncbi:MAG: hypothetical protein IKF17_01850 [Clostridia bacterium]|nr:hypothetical protein [Clostridia bacterium]
MKFKVNEKLFDEYEGLKIGVITCKNIDNTKLKNDISVDTENVKAHIKDKFADVELANYPVIRRWRDIYKSFGEKKSRSSIEALIRRLLNGHDIPSINPIVDIYNMLSLKYEVPCGGEDIDTISDDIELTYANGTESFICLGSTEEEHPNEGEIVYKSGNTVMCRNFNYRESDITKLTENTKNCVLVIESVIADNSDLDNALQELANMVQDNLGGETKINILKKENNEIEL